MLANIVSTIALVLAGFVVLANWACVFATYRLRQQGSKRHVSTVPIVVQILVILAVIVSQFGTGQWIPIWLFWFVAFLDPALFSVLYLPVFLFLRRYRARF